MVRVNYLLAVEIPFQNFPPGMQTDISVRAICGCDENNWLLRAPTKLARNCFSRLFSCFANGHFIFFRLILTRHLRHFEKPYNGLGLCWKNKASQLEYSKFLDVY